MKLTLTTSQIKDIHNLLLHSRSNSLDDADRIKIIILRQSVKTIGQSYTEFDNDARETLKFENFDTLRAKAEAHVLAGEELLAWNIGVTNYMKSLNAALEVELAKEYCVEVEPISQAVFLKLSKENDWSNAAWDILAPVIK